jgi:hypothetical protein
VVAHTGQSSQLFSVATGRNAQFLASSRIKSTLMTLNDIDEDQLREATKMTLAKLSLLTDNL